MKKMMIAIAAATSIFALSACQNDNAGGDSEVVVKTKAGNISKDELYDAMKDQVGEGILKELVYEKVLEKEYKVSDKEVNEEFDKLKENPQYQMILQNFNGKEDRVKDAIKSNLLKEKAAAKGIKVTDDEMKARYEDMKKNPQIKASHIIVADEKTANEVKAKLDKGEKFEDLAKEYSTDGTAQNGGDLGYFGKGQMDPDFEKAAYALKEGEISGVVKSSFGYHLIKLVDIKDVKEYDQMKDEIKTDLVREKLQSDPTAMDNALKKEIDKAKVDIKDKDLKDTFKEEPAAEANAGQ